MIDWRIPPRLSSITRERGKSGVGEEDSNRKEGEEGGEAKTGGKNRRRRQLTRRKKRPSSSWGIPFLILLRTLFRRHTVTVTVMASFHSYVLSLLLAVSLPVSLCRSSEREVTVEVPAGKEECFYESLAAGDTLDVDYQVVDGGRHNEIEINFRLSKPDGIPLVADFRRYSIRGRYLNSGCSFYFFLCSCSGPTTPIVRL